MPIQKHEFYEGAALHQLVRGSRTCSLAYEAPVFKINEGTQILLKYSTGKKSPWGFTLTPDEQGLLARADSNLRTVIGLICGSDGVAAIEHAELLLIAPPSGVATHVSCYRKHGEHYEVNGPAGALKRKVPPSDWRKLVA